MLRGIDISNWQSGIILKDMNIDFCICKATEGLYFVDGYCDGFIQQCIAKGIKWGFYHFANNNNPKAEAEYFVKHCKNYFGKGLPVLDIEDDSINDWGDYASIFCNRVYELTKVWPIIYCSASQVGRFRTCGIYKKCGLWIAGYPYPAQRWTVDNCPYNPSPWDAICIWQFTSDLKLPQYNGRLDANYCYLTKSQWDKYCKKQNKDDDKPSPKPIPKPTKELYQVAFDVIKGKYGTAFARKNKLVSEGYNYTQVQNYINELYSKAHNAIHGKYGNGETRKKKLGKDYDAVQYIINDILS